MAILNTNVNESTARLISITGQGQDAGFIIKRTWPWLQAAGLTTNDTHINTLYKTLAAVTSVTNPKANNDSYGGKFIASVSMVKDENEDGEGSRASTVIQTLTKVKIATDVASLGTPDIGSDQETLNFLGFQEGQKYHVYHKYRYIDPATEAVAMGLVPTASGYTIVKRKFDIEDDKSGTLYVVFEKDTWTATSWTASRKQVSYINYGTSGVRQGKAGGKGTEDVFELTGIPQGSTTTLATRARKCDTHRVVQNVTLIERGDGEYKISQRQGIAYESVSDTAAFIQTIKSNFNGGQQAGLIRVWPRRTKKASDTLASPAGRAMHPCKYRSQSYAHNTVHVTDNGDGTFDVTQQLMTDTSTGGGSAATYFPEVDEQVVKPFFRNSDDKVKLIAYRHHAKCFSSENAAWNWIKSFGTAGPDPFIVKGSNFVTKKAPFYFVGQVTMGSSQTLAYPLATNAVIGRTRWN